MSRPGPRRGAVPSKRGGPAARPRRVRAPCGARGGRAGRVRRGAAAGGDPIEAWDLVAIAGQYEAFVRTWEPVLPRIRSGGVRGVEAVQARTEGMDTHRQIGRAHV